MSLVDDINELDVDITADISEYKYMVSYVRYSYNRSRIILFIRILDIDIFKDELSSKPCKDNPAINLYDEIQDRLKYVTDQQYIMVDYGNDGWDLSFLYNVSYYREAQNKSVKTFFYNDIHLDSIVYLRQKFDNLLMYDPVNRIYSAPNNLISLDDINYLFEAC